MAYFTSRDIAAIALSGAIWSVLNVIISPAFWQATHLPFFCDMVGFTCLILATWWSRKLGTTMMTGLVATMINFFLRPGALHFVGFTAASIYFDIVSRLVGYDRLFAQNSIRRFLSLILLSLTSGTVAGAIIGSFFMDPQILSNLGGLLFFVVLHSTGGIIGGSIGYILIKALETRGVIPSKSI